MTDGISRLFAGPMPYQVRWLQDGRYRAATTYSRDDADRIYEDLVRAHVNPMMWLGGLVVRDDYMPPGRNFWPSPEVQGEAPVS